jgi:hypothetical protein
MYVTNLDEFHMQNQVPSSKFSNLLYRSNQLIIDYKSEITNDQKGHDNPAVEKKSQFVDRLS